MSAITAKASRKMKKYAVLTREPRCFLGSFDFSWEQRKFGEITSKYENPVPTPHDGYYRLGIRSHAKGTFHSYVAKGQELETAQMHRVAAGNFIVNITFGWEHAVAITDKNDAGKLVSHRFPQFSFAEGMVPEFFRYVIVDEKFRHHLWLASPGGAGRNRVLKLDEMLNYLMRFPSRDEQIKIAEFFRHLDNLITLHQRKCANLCSPSQVVFSLLFATSTFSWEQRKLGDVVQITMGQSPDGSTYSDEPSDYILVQGNADLQNGWVCPRIWTTQITKKADAGDLIMSVRAPAGAMGKTAYNAVIGRGVAAIKGNEFIYQLLVKMDADGFWKTLSCGSTFESLNSDNIKNAEVKIPTTAEQIKIGGYFQQLDNLITLHQRECISFTGRADRLILTANKKRTTSSWEQRKLGDIASDMVAGGDIDKDLILAEGQYPVIANALTGDGIVGYYDKEYRVNAPAVTVTGRGDVGHAKARLVNFTPVVRLLSVKSEHDVFFLENAINTLKIVIESTGVPQLTVPQLAKYEVAFPRQLDEEEHIGAFFKQLDHLITLHQRKPFLMKWRTSDANRNQTNRLVL